jgi:hypothetical protein
MLGAMMLRPTLVAIVTCLGLAACGGASHSSSNSNTVNATAATTTQANTSAPNAAAGSTTVSVTGVGTTTTASTSAPPEVPKAKKQKHHGSSHAASQGAHVETSMTVDAAGDVSPSVVSVPSGVGVELHVTNHGSAAETIALSVPGHPSVHVGPGAGGTLETGGLKDGTYRILVNGTPRGQLMIGAQGGP